MEESVINLSVTPPSVTRLSRRVLLVLLLVSILAVSGLMAAKAIQHWRVLRGSELISEQALAKEYGIQVNLVALTAVGGMVDLRLKVLDADKARLLLQDSNDLPTLLVGQGDTVLSAPEASTANLINHLADDGNIFLTFPNERNVVKPGMSVTILFGERHLGPTSVQ